MLMRTALRSAKRFVHRGSSAAVLRAVTATPENFAAFGQVLKPEDDGVAYDTRWDADLDGLGNGTPRLYLMRLEGPRPLVFDRITHHKEVSQCLGALGTTPDTADFYLAVHAPSEDVTMDGLQAFRVAPGTFVKLHCGTWHAGPLWGMDDERTYFNFELADTNVVDHHTVVVNGGERVLIEPPEE